MVIVKDHLEVGFIEEWFHIKPSRSGCTQIFYCQCIIEYSKTHRVSLVSVTLWHQFHSI